MDHCFSFSVYIDILTNYVLNHFSLRRDRFAKPQQDTNKKNLESKTTNDKSNLYKPSSQNLSSSLSRVDCGRYSLRTSRVPQPNSVCGVYFHIYLETL